MLVISEVSCEASLGPGVVELRSTMKIPFDTLLEVLAVAAAHGREEMNGTDQKERNASQAASLSQGNPSGFIIPFDIPETAAALSQETNDSNANECSTSIPQNDIERSIPTGGSDSEEVVAITVCGLGEPDETGRKPSMGAIVQDVGSIPTGGSDSEEVADITAVTVCDLGEPDETGREPSMGAIVQDVGSIPTVATGGSDSEEDPTGGSDPGGWGSHLHPGQGDQPEMQLLTDYCDMLWAQAQAPQAQWNYKNQPAPAPPWAHWWDNWLIADTVELVRPVEWTGQPHLEDGLKKVFSSPKSVAKNLGVYCRIFRPSSDPTREGRSSSLPGPCWTSENEKTLCQWLGWRNNPQEQMEILKICTSPAFQVAQQLLAMMRLSTKREVAGLLLRHANIKAFAAVSQSAGSASGNFFMVLQQVMLEAVLVLKDIKGGVLSDQDVCYGLALLELVDTHFGDHVTDSPPTRRQPISVLQSFMTDISGGRVVMQWIYLLSLLSNVNECSRAHGSGFPQMHDVHESTDGVGSFFDTRRQYTRFTRICQAGQTRLENVRDTVTSDALKFGCNEYGCRVVNLLLELTGSECLARALVAEGTFDILIRNEYGNHVVQKVLEFGDVQSQLGCLQQISQNISKYDREDKESYLSDQYANWVIKRGIYQKRKALESRSQDLAELMKQLFQSDKFWRAGAFVI